MAYIRPSTQSIKTCFQSHYSLPFFQREYKWDSRHFIELLNDIQNAFTANYEDTHGRKDVSNYPPYFLGSIITASPVNGKKPLIDGQQRLTSAFLILAYLERYRVDNSVPAALDLSSLLGSTNYGEVDYSVEFSASRKAIFNRYLDKEKSLSDAMAAAEDTPNMDDGDKKVLDALRAVEGTLSLTAKSAIAYFTDYVVERVLLIEISVDTESEAHRVFVTMNDRGLRLGPIDLLKGRILSKIASPVDSRKCHTAWNTTINTLRDIDPEEDSLFFRNLFRAKWATTIRGRKETIPRDFDIIGEAYHRWFEDNTSKLGLHTADDYVRFVSKDIPKFVEVYTFIKKAEEEIVEGFECIFFNAARRYEFQSTVLLAPVNASDNTADWKAKIALGSRLLDIILTTRSIEGKENSYDLLRYPSFAITNEIRDKSVSDLTSYLRAEWPKYFPLFDRLPSISYVHTGASEIRYFLARIETFLEEEISLENQTGFYRYWQRDKSSRTFDIEHILRSACVYTSFPDTHGFQDEADYSVTRNLIGGLALLPRSRNRALQDKSYREKLPVYAKENVLVQTLTEGFYQSNPKVSAYLAIYSSLVLGEISEFTKTSIDSRGESYKEISKRIWQAP